MAKRGGPYVIEVRRDEHESAAGLYEIALEELRAAAPVDFGRVAALLEFADGERLRRQGTTGSRLQAIEKLNQALSQFRVYGDRNWEATTLTEIGAVYHDLREGRKALD